ncbi:PAS domain S-box protein [Mariprofundus sp. NF]|uniref:PAS domain S-box protein n=1 Tax=Mariprofundus sp. NF TaxID=2608716 RepID=UPI0015A3E056|nr:DAHL domain-containing protein [Mariprofundus sp. NF]NWF39811.1 PAS domain S-box protein [Mariprofundus sp. NF]
MKAVSLKVHVLLIACLGLLLVMQLINVQRFDANEPHNIHYILERMEHLDTQSEQNMLQVYSRNLFHYDLMSRDLAELKSLSGELSLLLSNNSAFDDYLASLKTSVQIQLQGASEFKASYAILSNSLRYIPTLVSQLQADYPEHYQWLTELNRDVFQWSVYPNDQDAKARIQRGLNRTKELGLKRLHRHLQVILNYSPQVLDAIDTVVTCGTAENARELSIAYDRYFAAKVEENKRNQYLLAALAIVLLLYLLLLLIARQRAALQLSESEKRFQLLFDLIPDGVGIHRDGCWVYCNPAMLTMFGAQTEDELIGTPVIERVHPQLRDQVAERIRKEVDDALPAPLMQQGILRLDGSEFQAEVQGIPFQDKGRTVAMTVIRDVTARVEAEQEVKKVQQHLLAAQSVAHVGSWELDLTSSALWWSDEVYRIFEIEQTEFGASYEAFVASIHPDDRERVDSAYTRHLEESVAYDVRHRLLFDDGRIKYVRERCETERDAEGRSLTSIGTVQEITEQVLAEQKKLLQQEKMEHVQRLESLGILAGGIAHDFNNILTAVMGNAALAGRNIDEISPAREFLSRIETSTQRASDLCKQMLAYSGKGKFVVQAVNLSHLVEEMTRLMEVSIEKNVVIKYHMAENLPPVEADAAQLQQVILNLITNANEAIGSKSGVISFATGVMHADRNYLSQTITDMELPEGRYAFIEVSDTGCGMSADVMHKMFDPFFTTKFTGRGLGMSAVLGIVRGHQGALRIYSEVGKGTTFKVLLPVSSHDYVQEQAMQAEAQNWRADGTILVVDDEETVREVATMMLEDMGFKTLSAVDGSDALQVYRKHESEIVAVLLDMTMPKMDGKECFRELRRINPEVKVILSSGYNEQDATSRFVGQGLAGFLQKPYAPEALHEKIRIMFDNETDNLQ